MSGPIVRSGASPEFSKNWEKIFGGAPKQNKGAAAETKPEAGAAASKKKAQTKKSAAKIPAKAAKPAKKKPAKKKK